MAGERSGAGGEGERLEVGNDVGVLAWWCRGDELVSQGGRRDGWYGSGPGTSWFLGRVIGRRMSV